jgi:hypothetical protein
MASVKKSSRRRISRTKSPTANRNTSFTTADGRSVRIKDGVKTYSDKPLQVTGKGGISISGKEYSRNRGGTGFAPVLTKEALAPTDVMNVPPPPVTPPTADLTKAGNTGITSLLSGLGYTSDATSGQIVAPAPGSAEEATAASNNTMAQQLQGLLGMRQAPESQADIYAKEYKAQGIQKAQNEVNNYTSQLNAITAKAQAESLGLEGQGRGVTESIIGGQQAKINREAAIQALPVQAQLAAAQGNLEFAQQQLNTVFQLKVADSKAKTDYWNGLVDTAMNFATTAQQNILNAKLADINTRSQKEQANLSLVNQWAQMAVETGQSGLISKFTALDPKSPTFAQDFGKLQAQVRKPVEATAQKAPTLQNFGTSDKPMWKQYNYATGKWDTVEGADSSVVREEQSKIIADELATKITNIGNLKLHEGLNSAVGAVGLGRVALIDAFGAKDEFIGKVEQLVSREFLDTLISAKAKGATFGALTKPEQDALTNAATAIGQWRMTDKVTGKTTGYDIDEQSFKNELDTLITLAQKAESVARGYDVTSVPQYDSILIDNIVQDYQKSLLLQDFSNFYPQ